MNPAAAAAATVVGIFCLLISCRLVSSAPTTVAETPADSVSGSALFTKIDGQVVAQCSVRWEGGYSTQDKKLYLISTSKNTCYECGPCTATGIQCEKITSRSCPVADLSESSGSGSGSGSGSDL